MKKIANILLIQIQKCLAFSFVVMCLAQKILRTPKFVRIPNIIRIIIIRKKKRDNIKIKYVFFPNKAIFYLRFYELVRF